MKISLNWIEKYTDIKFDPKKLKERMDVSLTEIEEVESFGKKYKGFVTAKVTNVDKHPESKKLLKITLDIGKDREVNSVVQICEVKPGDITVFIKPGLKIPTIGEKVKKVEIKGVKSDGFVPSGRELGLNYDHTNVYLLPERTKIGVELSKVLDIDDEILEIKNKTLTHRPDCFGLYGIAREIAAMQGTELKPIEWLEDSNVIKLPDAKSKEKITIDNKVPDLCNRYVAVIIKNVDVKPSPLWLQIELAKMGVHPVNNIVDISNYLMLLTGQPSHCFDYDKIMEDESEDHPVLTIRKSKKGEKVVTLDDKEREMDGEILVIGDSKKAIAVAGVMGGKETEIDNNTKNVIYQVENLDMYSIRRSSMKLGMFSDAVTRFAKGIDQNLCGPVMYKGVEMMLELAGGDIYSDIVDDFPGKLESWELEVETDIIRERMGIEIEDSAIEDILIGLGISVKNGKRWTLTIPTFRNDIRIPEDINEEVARIYGYDKVDPKLPERKITPVSDDKYLENINKVKHILKSLGSHEMYTYSFVSEDLYRNCGLSMDNAYKLVNAISPELLYMRPLLYPSLLSKVPSNYKELGDFSSFEVEKVNPEKVSRGLPNEPWHLAIINTASYYHLKLYLDNLLDVLTITDWELIPLGESVKQKMDGWVKYAQGGLHPLRSALIRVGKDIIGLIGEIDEKVEKSMDLPSRTSVLEIDLDGTGCYIEDKSNYKTVSRYPSVKRDYSLLVKSSILYRDIISSIKSIKSDLIWRIEPVDIFGNGKDDKKVTVRITYLSKDKTLVDEDIAPVEKKILKSIEKNVGGKLAK